ncbi:MAG: threonine synthase [Peptococcaceae bacterium]|nr:threonine synthase [Peptococcaceae bacterium]
MKYISTRDNSQSVSAAEAIVRGMVPEGGLYVPESIPSLDKAALGEMVDMRYQDMAEKILGLYLADFSAEEIHEIVNAAYNAESFDSADVAPVVKLRDGLYVLELWHGPTAAFKDMALQILPHLLVHSMKKTGVDKEVVILVATSGDTGKAALEGFKDVAGTRIIAFYPDGGVSEVQELQMLTTSGSNTYTFAVKGNFDDCQRAVKEAFANEALVDAVADLGCQFSSANSINWGRLLPQIVYYFFAYMQLVKRGEIALGDAIDFTVPTGNFGNILAGWFAREMGLPVSKLVCASNANDVLDEFIRTGVYNANRPFLKTNSPSMDILISSNLERFLYLMSERNGQAVTADMQALQKDGKYSVAPEVLARIQDVLASGAVDEAGTLDEIGKIFDECGYLLDTHTAIAVRVAEAATDGRAMVVDSTANPYKFVNAVWQGVSGEASGLDDLALLGTLSEKTDTPVHRALANLTDLPKKDRRVIAVADINDAILDVIKNK